MAERREDGGNAFPLPLGTANAAEPSQSGGMSLRDWFAGMALQGIIARTTVTSKVHAIRSKRAYQYADAMLAERSKP